MIVIDINILIYAYHTAAPLHRPAKRWVEKTFLGSEPVGLAWSVLHAFLRLTTGPGILSPPMSMVGSASILSEWLSRPIAHVVEPGNRYWPVLHRLLIDSQIRGGMVMDAHLAALTIENAAILYTTDKDFSRFDELRVVNPLV